MTGASPNYFHVLVHDSKCALEKTSTLAQHSHCSYAINGGPFNSYIHGGCIGLTISNGIIIHNGVQSDSSTLSDDNDVDVDVNAAFGVTHNDEWIIGNVQKYNHSNIKELITGLNGWLVRNSTIVPEEGGGSAPRTAIGVDRDGNLVLLQVDGCEHCFFPRKRGLTLYEMANAMKEYTEYAINLDGGGSSTSVMNDTVLNNPTCLDYVDVWCERPVASAICIRHDAIPFKMKP